MERHDASGIGPRRRTLPRPFTYPWGGGQVVEEASAAGQYHEPSIQLLQYDDGSLSIRFCYFNHAGRFERSPLVVAPEDLPGLREALQSCPQLLALVRTLVERPEES